MDAIQPVVPDGRRRRRRHTEQFKAAVVAECSRGGVSIAAVALANGLNANLVRRWVVEQERGGALVRTSPPEALPAASAAPREGFVPVAIEAGQSVGQDIRVEIRAGAKLVSVHWPITVAGECGVWLRELLR